VRSAYSPPAAGGQRPNREYAPCFTSTCSSSCIRLLADRFLTGGSVSPKAIQQALNVDEERCRALVETMCHNGFLEEVPANNWRQGYWRPTPASVQWVRAVDYELEHGDLVAGVRAAARRNRLLACILIAAAVLLGLTTFANQLLQLLKAVGLW